MADDIVLMPGDLVENNMPVRGDQDTVLEPGNQFKVVATDGAFSFLVKLEDYENEKIATAEIFTAPNPRFLTIKNGSKSLELVRNIKRKIVGGN